MNTKSEILRVEFHGNGSEKLAVSMSDVGHTLVALQQMIYKCYLYNEGRLKPGAKLKKENRDAFALQVASIEEGSFILALAPFMKYADVVTVLIPVVQLLIKILSDYRKRRVEQRISDEVKESNLLNQIYDQMKELARRIGGNIQSIEFVPTNGFEVNKVVIDTDTRDYVRSLAKKLIPVKKKKTIEALVKRIDVREYWANVIETKDEKKFRVIGLEDNDIDMVIHELDKHKGKEKEREPEFIIKGRPIRRIGKGVISFQLLELDSIKLKKKPVPRQPKKKAVSH